MAALKSSNLIVTFLLELAMLAALAYWGLQTDASLPVRIALGVGTPLVVALIWARFMAPKSRRRLTGTPYLVLKAVLFGAAAIALVVTGEPALALVFVVMAVINQALMMVWKQ
jgi:hypothetical protein